MKAVKLFNQLRSFAVPDNLQVKIVHRKDGVDEHYHIKPHQSPIEGLQTIRATKEVSGWAGKNPVANNFEPQDTESIKMMHWLEKKADPVFKHEDWSNPVGGIRKVSQITDPDELEELQDELSDGNYSHNERFDLVLKQAFNVDYNHPEFDQKAQELGNVQELWHGVSNQRAAGLINTGFKTPRDVGVSNGGMFGPGIYFADSPGKSGQYIGEGAMWKSGNTDDLGVLLKCDVVMGDKIFKAYSPRNTEPNEFETKDNEYYQDDYKKLDRKAILDGKATLSDAQTLLDLHQQFQKKINQDGIISIPSDDLVWDHYLSVAPKIDDLAFKTGNKKEVQQAIKKMLDQKPPEQLRHPVKDLSEDIQHQVKAGQYQRILEDYYGEDDPDDTSGLEEELKRLPLSSYSPSARDSSRPFLRQIKQELKPLMEQWGEHSQKMYELGSIGSIPRGLSLNDRDKEIARRQKAKEDYKRDLQYDRKFQKTKDDLLDSLDKYKDLGALMERNGISMKNLKDAMGKIGSPDWVVEGNRVMSEKFPQVEHIVEAGKGEVAIKKPTERRKEVLAKSSFPEVIANSMTLRLADELGLDFEQLKDRHLDLSKYLYHVYLSNYPQTDMEHHLEYNPQKALNKMSVDDKEVILDMMNPEMHPNLKLKGKPTSLEAATHDDGGSVQYPEMVVYNRNQAKIRKVLIVERKRRN